MKTLKRHRWSITTLALGAAILGAVWMQYVPAGSALADPPAPTPLTQVDRDAIGHLMGDVSLDRDGLVALNLSAQQAESVVSGLRNWWETNQATLATLQAAIDDAVHAVRQLERAMAMGPPQAGQAEALALAREELDTAQTAYRTALGSLTTTVDALLSESQRTTWLAIRSGFGHAMPLRMLGVTDAQRLALGDAQHEYRRQLGAAATQEAHTAAIAAWQTSLGQILSAAQQDVMSAYYTNYASASDAVASAIDVELPVANG